MEMKVFRILRSRLLAIGALALILGCGKPSDRVEVSGTVRWQDQMLSSGTITFFRPQQIPAGAGEIVNGKYRVQCKPGQLRVEIEAIREIGAVDRAEGLPVQEQYLPARYNRNSTLTAEISPPGPVVLDFDLEDK